MVGATGAIVSVTPAGAIVVVRVWLDKTELLDDMVTEKDLEEDEDEDEDDEAKDEAEVDEDEGDEDDGDEDEGDGDEGDEDEGVVLLLEDVEDALVTEFDEPLDDSRLLVISVDENFVEDFDDITVVAEDEVEVFVLCDTDLVDEL